MGKILDTVKKYRAGRIDFEALVEFIVDFPFTTPSRPNKQGNAWDWEDDPLYHEDTWEEVTYAQDRGLLTAEEGQQLHRAYYEYLRQIGGGQIE